MKLIFAILIVVGLALAGCGDPVGAGPDTFWSGRGAALYTEGLALDTPGTVATINVDGSGGSALFTGAIPCPPRAGKIVYADVSYIKPEWAIYLADQGGTGAPRKLVWGTGNKPNFGIVDLSRTASKVLYVLYDIVNLRSTLYVVDVASGAQTQISDKVVNFMAAAFSHDEGRVAFYAGTGQNELTVVDLATGIPAVVAANARPWSIDNLDWSPGGMLAYVGGDTGSGGRNIYVIDPNVGTPAPLTFDTVEDNRWPVWSPDGSMIAYIHGRELWVMMADGNGKRQITSPSEWPYQIKMFPQWSADQSMILFTAVAGNGVQGLLQVVDLGTLRVNALATGAARGFWQ